METILKTFLYDIRKVAKKKGLNFNMLGQLISDYYTLMEFMIENFEKIYKLVKASVYSSKYRSYHMYLTILPLKLKLVFQML